MGLAVHDGLLTEETARLLVKACPFGAIEYSSGRLSIGMGCRMCRLCVKKSNGAVTFDEEPARKVDKGGYSGVLVFCEHFHGDIHNVTFELLGKARELTSVTGQKVLALMIGGGIAEAARELYFYGADEVYAYDDAGLKDFMIEPYANVLSDFIGKLMPSSILVGATNVGRSLAPRVAARLHTGLTADCTALEMNEDTDLVQIRPAFGGNIMARIMTPANRPQFCTVRYKVFSKPERILADRSVHLMHVEPWMLSCRTEILDIEARHAVSDISESEVLVQVGRGVKSQKDLAMIKGLADAIGAQMACTRPLVENHWFDSRQQIGLSGRTVKPKLLICIGVSGAVQTVAGIKGSDCIIAINSDPEAPIFNVASYGFVGDLYQILPLLLKKLGKEASDVQ